ncbi:MAG: DUF1611 domain-containing protein [Lachnospiraceae bacterium]|nr:DUF1611 domain-containing protein [Lachnospiraceae bacterium]
MTRERFEVVIIDSGIKWDDSLSREQVAGKSIMCRSDGEVAMSDDFIDRVGHGTAVADCLFKEKAFISHLYSIKIYDDSETSTNAESLIASLEYIEKNIVCDIVIISSGVVCTDKLEMLRDRIERLIKKNVIIVSAFDNDGLMSYPAAFDVVIGVATNSITNELPRISEVSKVDIVLQEKKYRLKWVNPAKIIVGGSSFAAPVVAAKLTHILAKKEGAEKMIKSALLKELAKELDIPYIQKEERENIPSSFEMGQAFSEKIRKAIVFPWNKEISAIARYQDLLSFDIVGFYDIKYSLNVGRGIGEILGTGDSGMKIQNIDSLDWSDEFDTVICGHCGVISEVTNRKWLEEIAAKCQRYNKRLYAFDREAENYCDLCEVFIPAVCREDIPRCTGGRLFERCVPIVGVFGTSSKQGKYSVQLELRRRFLRNHYHVRQITSEPSGYLFGADIVFPYGYHSNTDIRPEETALIINHMISQIVKDDTDVVLVGGQSGSTPFCYNNLAQMNFIGHGFLCGTNPDVYVLCVNPHDPIEYIKNTINYLQSFNGSRICALVLFPVITEVSTAFGYGLKSKKLTLEELRDISKQLEYETHIPVRILGNSKDMDELFQSLITELSEE